MFVKGDKLYYIDTHDGIIYQGNFLEDNSDGIWIKLKGHLTNNFVYSDLVSERVFKDFNHAQTGLETIKNEMKNALLQDDKFVKDILERLRKNEGKLYSSIIEEILYEKTGLSVKKPS